MPSSTTIFAKRSLRLNKAQSGMGIVFVVIGLLFFNVLPFLYPEVLGFLYLTAVPFMVLGMFIFATPVLPLYTYDKNNGVLEYLISLGWNQSDVFKRYLKAALLLALYPFLFILAFTMVVDTVAGAQAYILHDLTWLALVAVFGFADVAVVTIALMAFSSLQKPVGGNANSPLVLTIGALIIIPTFYVQIASYSIAVLVDILIPIILISLAVALLILSSRLIRREKMLP